MQIGIASPWTWWRNGLIVSTRSQSWFRISHFSSNAFHVGRNIGDSRSFQHLLKFPVSFIIQAEILQIFHVDRSNSHPDSNWQYWYLLLAYLRDIYSHRLVGLRRTCRHSSALLVFKHIFRRTRKYASIDRARLPVGLKTNTQLRDEQGVDRIWRMQVPTSKYLWRGFSPSRQFLSHWVSLSSYRIESQWNETADSLTIAHVSSDHRKNTLDTKDIGLIHWASDAPLLLC